MKVGTLASAVFLSGLAAIAPGLAGADRAPVTPFPPGAPHRAPWELNRELLLPENQGITFLVDVPRGAKPKVEALDHLVRLASSYGGRKAKWLPLNEVPGTRISWEDRIADLEPTVSSRKSLSPDGEDTRRISQQVPRCEGEKLPLDTTFVFVRYVGTCGRCFGVTGQVTSGESCGKREFVVIYLAQGRIARQRPPGMPQAFFEMRALAHEYGHALGVGSNPEHGEWISIVPYRGGAHCVNHECAVSVPTGRALLKGKMLDYCDDCRRDIDHAREFWLQGTLFPESPRLPQPSVEAELARLKTYQFREGTEAERLLHYGKAALPPLMKRMETLKGGHPSSPREQAALLVAKIIATEDAERRGVEAPPLERIRARRQLSDALLRWWEQEGDKFMSGDDWTLPALPPAQ